MKNTNLMLDQRLGVDQELCGVLKAVSLNPRHTKNFATERNGHSCRKTWILSSVAKRHPARRPRIPGVTAGFSLYMADVYVDGCAMSHPITFLLIKIIADA